MLFENFIHLFTVFFSNPLCNPSFMNLIKIDPLYLFSIFIYIFLNPPSPIRAFNMGMGMVLEPWSKSNLPGSISQKKTDSLPPAAINTSVVGIASLAAKLHTPWNFDWLVLFRSCACMLWVHKWNSPDMFSKHSFTIVFPDASFALTRAWTITG